MLPRNHPDRIRIAFDDPRLVANAGLVLPATLALHLGLGELVDRHLDLGGAPGRANTGDKLMTLVASALAGGDCIDRVDSGRGQNRTLRLLSAFWPPVFAGEQDVSPPKGRDVGQELGLNGQSGVFPLSDRFVEMGGIPVNDDGGEQVEPSHAIVLVLAGAVADFALAPDAQRVLERVMSLALVQAGVGPALHIGVEQPVDDEERTFDPSDFTESDSQFVLARIGRELSQQLAGRKSAAGQGGSDPQDVRPVPHDHVLPYFVAGQSGQGFGKASGLEDMQPFRRKVTDARDEPVAKQGCDGEDMVGETAGVGVLLADATPGPGHQQPVENIGRFVDRGWDGLRCEGSEPVRDMGYRP